MNKLEKKYKVYKYTSPSNKVYIGQTCNSLKVRAANGEGYKECPKFFEAIKKYGFDQFQCEVLKDELTLEEANYWEEYYIKIFKSTDDRYGYNISYGGSNRVVSDETKEKMKNSHLGMRHTNETKQKISNALSNRKLSDEHKQHLSESCTGRQGYHFNEEQRKNISNKLKNHPSMSKKVQCIETGIIYDSAAEAARQLGLSSASHINDCITNPKRYKTAGGFHWRRIEK